MDIQAGDTVICIDDKGAGHALRTGDQYYVESINYELDVVPYLVVTTFDAKGLPKGGWAMSRFMHIEDFEQEAKDAMQAADVQEQPEEYWDGENYYD